MQKRSQITVFLILGIILIVVFGLMYYANTNKRTTTVKTQATKENVESTDIVNSYAENCIKKAAEEALFNRIGLQGGFINPNGDVRYKEEGIRNSPITPPTTLFDDKIIPYFLEVKCNEHCHQWEDILDCRPKPEPCEPDCSPICTVVGQRCVQNFCHWGYTEYIPSLDSIKEKLGNYIKVEFEKCFNTKVFEDIGMKFIKPSAAKISVDIGLNEEDVSIKLTYPLTIIKDKTQANIDSFAITLPIRLKALYESAKHFVNQIKNVPEMEMPPSIIKYIIMPDCGTYDKNHLTNVYFKNNEIVQFVDFSTYKEKYLNSFIFQFAVKNVNVNGACVG